MSDLYTKVVLTVIAASLLVIALRGTVSPVAPAFAGDSIECRFAGPLKISDFSDTLEVKVEHSYSTPGHSSGSPMYVKTVQ
jgi:hypothetical protein